MESRTLQLLSTVMTSRHEPYFIHVMKLEGLTPPNWAPDTLTLTGVAIPAAAAEKEQKGSKKEQRNRKKVSAKRICSAYICN